MTTSRSLETIYDCLTKLHGYTYFRPQEGPLKERLAQAILDAADEDVCEELSEAQYDLEVSIGSQDAEGELSLSIALDRPGVVCRSQLAVTLLSDAELDDLAHYLKPAEEPSELVDNAPAGKTIVRKAVEEHDHHEKEAAAARLKVSTEWLKSVVPCTDYSYEEIDGKKYIREYYWSKDLIERLFKIKCNKTTPEDLQYVAKECCEGDLEWAKDLIARLKSPNRPEPAPREQAQKGQGKLSAGSQLKGPLPKAPHGKHAPHKHPSHVPAAVKPSEQAMQPKSGAVTGGNSGAEAESAGGAGGTRERSRRSRHRKHFRHRKEGGAKPENHGEQKQPPK
ncbi:hypothetical protein [Geomonas sp.]|uniref:hypothetical protein n=1 Tax=Geomonas sp. TaxID=2651584 RepID=UPI002B46E018|nr:hypothetical protein [Geomonas sp.]HJV34554.1 hypothetical protein [Geomonas sp.]